MKRTIQIFVEEHEELPDGCTMVFEAVGEARSVSRVVYEGEEWAIEAVFADRRGPATAVPVSDSGAGTSMLVYGGDWGLRLRRAASGSTSECVAEPYLLLDEAAVLS